MASIVKTPWFKEGETKRDDDFIAFSYDGKHSIEDFGIYRVADANNGYNIDLSLSSDDKTATVPGMDGKYYLGSQKKEKVFNIKIAFDHLTEEKLNEVKIWLDTSKIADLWFAEAPHKVYGAKVTGLSTTTALIVDENGERVYKGTGSIQFTCYNPYAHTPDYVEVGEPDVVGNRKRLPGNAYQSYAEFENYERIKTTLPLYGVAKISPKTSEVDSYWRAPLAFGEQPFYFIAHLQEINDPSKITIHSDVSGDEYIFEGPTRYFTGDNAYLIFIQQQHNQDNEGEG